MSGLNKIYLFRMTHIDNVPHILAHGITHRSSKNSHPDYVAIGDNSIIQTRAIRRLPNGKPLGAHIPFYFWYRMPMLYVIQNGYNSVKATGPKDIVYCVCTVASIMEHHLPFCFTDGHAIDSFSDFYTADEIDHIAEIVDFKAVKATWWKDEQDLDLKRRKEAEFLVDGDVPVAAIKRYIAYNAAAKERLTELGVDEAIILVKPGFYF